MGTLCYISTEKLWWIKGFGGLTRIHCMCTIITGNYAKMQSSIYGKEAVP